MRNFSPLLGPVVALLAGPLACQGRGVGEPALLTLGKESVPASEFQRHLQRLESRGDGPLDPAVRAAVLEKFLEERVLALEARRRGLVPPGAGAEAEVAATQRLLQAEVVAKIQVAPEDVARYYAEHRDEYNLPERRTVSQILLPNLNEARDVRRRLVRDPKAFELLARTRSRAPEGPSGGRMGSFAAGELPSELEQAVFGLRVGDHGQIVESPYGFHVLRLDAVEPARERPLQECQGEIEARLRAQRADAAVQAFLRELLSRAKVNHEVAKPAAAS